MVCTLTFVEDHSIVELLLEPGEVARKGNAVADVRLSESINLSVVLDRFHGSHRGRHENDIFLK